MNNQPVNLPANPTIVVTDSGLGGISVLAEIEQLIRMGNTFNEAKLIYFNAHPQKGHGYNSMKSGERKAEVFNDALTAMIAKFDPDLILIACNTLSIVYPYTEIARAMQTKVIGIAEFAVNLFYENLINDPDSFIILYGTPTTINSDVYKTKLVEMGIDSGRIINQPCYLLETEIQTNPAGAETERMINEFTLQAKRSLPEDAERNSKCFAGFCCTHYGYSTALFEKALSANFAKFGILNPNSLMSCYVVSAKEESYSNTKISVEVHSRVEISEEEISSIGNIIKEDAPLTSLALTNYKYDLKLFDFVV